MDLRSLRYFVATVEVGTVSGAALRCHVAQPSISSAILQLEQEFNQPLFIRQAKGVVPTEAGLKFYQHAKSLLVHADEMRRYFLQPEARELVSLYVPPTVSSGWLADWWRTLRERGETIRWQLVSDKESADITLQLQRDVLDEQYFYPVQEQHYHMLCHAGLPLAYQRRITLEELAQLPLVERRHCELREMFMSLQAGAFGALNVVAQVDNEDWALALVSAGVGITFAPLGPQPLPEHVMALPLSRIECAPPVTRVLGLAVRAQHSRLALMRSICETLTASVNQT